VGLSSFNNIETIFIAHYVIITNTG